MSRLCVKPHVEYQIFFTSLTNNVGLDGKP